MNEGVNVGAALTQAMEQVRRNVTAIVVGRTVVGCVRAKTQLGVYRVLEGMHSSPLRDVFAIPSEVLTRVIDTAQRVGCTECVVSQFVGILKAVEHYEKHRAEHHHEELDSYVSKAIADAQAVMDKLYGTYDPDAAEVGEPDPVVLRSMLVQGLSPKIIPPDYVNLFADTFNGNNAPTQ